MATQRTRPRQPPTTAPEYPEHLGFILAEEEALKAFLEQMVTLPDNKGTEQPVRVWFRYPSAEHATTYPFVTLDLIGIEPAYDVWHSEHDLHPDSEIAEDPDTGAFVERRLYDPSTSPVVDGAQWPGMFFRRRQYLSYRLFYQIGMWTRNAVHDRILSARMIRDVILPRPSWLFVPADECWRRMEMTGWTPADLATQEGADKRIFRKMFTLSILTDIPQDRLANLALQPRIQKLLVRMNETNSGEWMTGSDQTPSTVTTIPPTEWWEQYAQP